MIPFPETVFIAAEYDDSGDYSLRAVGSNGSDCDISRAARCVAAVIICGRGVVTKPSDSDIARRASNERDTFVSSRSGDSVSIFRRERTATLAADLRNRGIVPVGWFCATDTAEISSVIGLFAATVRESMTLRRLLRPENESSAILQAIVRRLCIPVLATALLLLIANTAIRPRIEAECGRLRETIAVREDLDYSNAAERERRQAFYTAFASRPSLLRSVICDRIAVAVPDDVRLTAVEIEPLRRRIETDKPVERREGTATINGTAPTSGSVAAFVARLSATELFRSVDLTSIERDERDRTLRFGIELRL